MTPTLDPTGGRALLNLAPPRQNHRSAGNFSVPCCVVLLTLMRMWMCRASSKLAASARLTSVGLHLLVMRYVRMYVCMYVRSMLLLTRQLCGPGRIIGPMCPFVCLLIWTVTFCTDFWPIYCWLAGLSRHYFRRLATVHHSPVMRSLETLSGLETVFSLSLSWSRPYCLGPITASVTKRHADSA